MRPGQHAWFLHNDKIRMKTNLNKIGFDTLMENKSKCLHFYYKIILAAPTWTKGMKINKITKSNHRKEYWGGKHLFLSNHESFSRHKTYFFLFFFHFQMYYNIIYRIMSSCKYMLQYFSLWKVLLKCLKNHTRTKYKQSMLKKSQIINWKNLWFTPCDRHTHRTHHSSMHTWPCEWH